MLLRDTPKVRVGNQVKAKSVVLRCVSSTIITAGILLASLAAQHMWPFGDTSMFLWDMEIQYVNLYNWFHDVLHGNASVFYDFSKSLGGNMYSIFAIFFLNPINLLTYFFSPEHMPECITLITLLKIVVAAFCCELFLCFRFKNLPGGMQIALACSYALCEYNVGLCSNLHFIDFVGLLPLMALATYYFVKTDRGLPMALAFGITISFSWYIGYMCCIAIGLYFLAELFLQGKPNKIPAFAMFLLFAVIGIMIGAFSFIPSLVASAGGKGHLNFELLVPAFHCSPFEPLKALLPTAQANVSYEEPAIYTGLFPLAALVVCLGNKRVDGFTKLCAVTPLFIAFVSFSFIPLETAWTVFSKTYSFYFRYSFAFSFFLVWAAGILLDESIVRGCETTYYHLFSCFVIACLFVLHFLLAHYLGKRGAVFFLSLFALFLLISHHALSPRSKDMASASAILETCLLILLISADTGYNTVRAFARYNIGCSEYARYTTVVGHEVNRLAASSDTFYRMDKTFSEMDVRRGILRPIATEGLTFNYNAITHYSSLIDRPVNKFLDRMGYFRYKDSASNYVTSNPLMDSILGLRYLLSDKDFPLLDIDNTFELPDGRTINTYANRYALGLATFIANKPDVTWSKNNPFENQTAMLSNMLGREVTVFIPQTVSQEDTHTWKVTAQDAGPIYAYFIGKHDETMLRVDDEELQPYYRRFYKNVFCLGRLNAGDSVTVSLDGKQNCKCSLELVAYRVDEDVYGQALSELQDKTYQPSVFKDTNVKLELTAENQPSTALITIPYDKGWKLTLDGNRIDPVIAYDAFYAVDIPVGTHIVEFSYTPPTLWIGICLSLASLGTLIVLDRFLGRRKADQTDLDKDEEERRHD